MTRPAGAIFAFLPKAAQPASEVIRQVYTFSDTSGGVALGTFGIASSKPARQRADLHLAGRRLLSAQLLTGSGAAGQRPAPAAPGSGWRGQSSPGTSSPTIIPPPRLQLR